MELTQQLYLVRIIYTIEQTRQKSMYAHFMQMLGCTVYLAVIVSQTRAGAVRSQLTRQLVSSGTELRRLSWCPCVVRILLAVSVGLYVVSHVGL